jgi:hypothetical protein
MTPSREAFLKFVLQAKGLEKYSFFFLEKLFFSSRSYFSIEVVFKEIEAKAKTQNLYLRDLVNIMDDIQLSSKTSRFLQE